MLDKKKIYNECNMESLPKVTVKMLENSSRFPKKLYILPTHDD